MLAHNSTAVCGVPIRDVTHACFLQLCRGLQASLCGAGGGALALGAAAVPSVQREWEELTHQLRKCDCVHNNHHAQVIPNPPLA